MRSSISLIFAAMLMLTPFRLFAADDAAAAGKMVKFDYTLTVDNEQLETTVGKQPLEITLGNKTIVPGLESGLIGMRVGEEKIITVSPKDGYGYPDAKMIKNFPKSSMPKGGEIKPGMVLSANSPDGNVFPATVKEVKANDVLLDFNHPLAGKQLQFKVKILAVSSPGSAPAQAMTPAVKK